MIQRYRAEQARLALVQRDAERARKRCAAEAMKALPKEFQASASEVSHHHHLLVCCYSLPHPSTVFSGRSGSARPVRVYAALVVVSAQTHHLFCCLSHGCPHARRSGAAAAARGRQSGAASCGRQSQSQARRRWPGTSVRCSAQTEEGPGRRRRRRRLTLGRRLIQLSRSLAALSASPHFSMIVLRAVASPQLQRAAAPTATTAPLHIDRGSERRQQIHVITF